MKWYAGSDHAGYQLKRRLVKLLEAAGDTVVDVGTDNEESVDYPDFGASVGRRVTSAEPGESEVRGLLVCGTGIGISIAANKIAGVRAALVTDAFTAQASRAHNNANVIAFGSRVTGTGVAEQALKVFRETAFEGGRHQRRIDKVSALDVPPDAPSSAQMPETSRS